MFYIFTQNTATGHFTRTTLDGVDPKSNWKIVTSDIFGNVIQVTEPNPQNGQPAWITSYIYNRVNQLTQVSMPRNGYPQTRTMTYDPATLKLLSETHPETGTTSYQYQQGPHQEWRMWIKTDAKNQQSKTDSYDAYNRPLAVKFLNPVSGGWAEDICQRISYTYDTYPAAAGLGNPAWGHKTTSQVGPGDNTASCAVSVAGDGSRYNQTFTQAFAYTSPGQLALKRLIFTQVHTAADLTQQPGPGATWDTAYTYDDEGYQISTTFPSGLAHNIGLDFLKRPNTLTSFRPGQNVAGPIIDGVSYNAADQVTQMSWPANTRSNGSGGRDYDATTYPAFTETHTYNQFNQVTQIQTQVSGAPSGVDLNYGYSAGTNNGQIASVTSGLDGNFNAFYTYDSLNRLAAVSGAKSQSYSYDGWGNLYSKTGDGSNFTVNIDPATNRPSGAGICYDPNGNLISLVTQCAPEYSYDIQNRLVRVAFSSTGAGDQSAEVYLYTSDNKRVAAVRPNGSPAEVFYMCTVQLFGRAPTCGPADLKFAGLPSKLS